MPIVLMQGKDEKGIVRCRGFRVLTTNGERQNDELKRKPKRDHVLIG